MNIEFEHKRSSLMSKTKKELVEQIIRLEHNVNVLHDTIDTQVKNFKELEKQAYKKGREDYEEKLKRDYERKSRCPWI